MGQTPEQLATALLKALTPSGKSLVDAEVRLTALSPATALVQDLVDKGHPQELATETGKTLMTTLFTNAMCFGMPKHAPDPKLMPQLVYSASTVTSYCNILKMLLNGLRMYCTSFWDTTISTTKGKVTHSSFQTEAVGLVSYFSVIQIFVQACDIENQLFPETYGIPLLTNRFVSLQQSIVQFIQGGDQLRVDVANGQSKALSEANFSISFQSIGTSLPTYVQLLDTVIIKVQSLFEPMYSEIEYIEWQKYCLDFTGNIVLLITLCLRIGTSDPRTFHTLQQILHRLSTLTFNVISPIQTLLRFRGSFEDGLKQANDAWSTFTTALMELLQEVMRAIPHSNTGIQEFYSIEVAQLIEAIQDQQSQYQEQLEKLIVAVKKDRRFGVFTAYAKRVNSDLTETAAPAIATASKLVLQLLKSEDTPMEVLASEKLLLVQHQNFSSFLTKYISNEQNSQRKIALVDLKSVTALAVEHFVKECQKFIGHSQNRVLRLRAGMLAVNVGLCLCSLDADPVLLEHLGSIREALQCHLVEFFPSNLKDLLEILQCLFSQKSEMDPAAETSFSGIFSLFLSKVKESTVVFARNSNPTVPDNVIACVREYDKMQIYLQAMNVIVKNAKISSNLQEKVAILDAFANCVKCSADYFRFILQLHFRQATEIFIQQMTPFLELVCSVATLQSDSYYQSFLRLKSEITIALTGVQDELKHIPPHGIYDHQFLMGLVASVISVFQPSATLIGECQKILQFATSPEPIRNAINNVTQTLNVMTQMMPYVNTIYVQHKLQLSTHLSFVIKEVIDQVEEEVSYIRRDIETNSLDLGCSSSRLIRSIYELAETTDAVEEYHSIAEQLRKLGRTLFDISGQVALGDAHEKLQLIAATESIKGLTLQLQPGVSKCLGIGDRPTKMVSVEPYKEFISSLPEPKDIDGMLASVMALGNESMKGVLSGCIGNMKEAVDEFNRVYQQFKKNPSLSNRLKELARKIQQCRDTVTVGLKFTCADATCQALDKLLKQYKAFVVEEEKISMTPKLLVNIAALISNTTTDPVRRLLTTLLAEISREDYAIETTRLRIETFAECLNGNAVTKTLELIEKVRATIPSRDKNSLDKLISQLILADRIAKAVVGVTDPLTDPKSIQSQIIAPFSNFGTTQANKDLMRLINALEDSIVDDEDISESSISERLLDLNSEITALGTAILTDIKKTTTGNVPRNIETMRIKAIDAAAIVLHASSRHLDSNRTNTLSLHHEIAKLLENIEIFRKEATASPNQSQLRVIGKANRDITMSLNKILSLSDEILESPQQIDASNYTQKSSALLTDVLSLAKLSLDPTSILSSKRFSRIITSLKTNIATFSTTCTSIVQGTDMPFQEKLRELQTLFASLSGPFKSTSNIPQRALLLTSEISKLIADTLNTEITPQPEAVALLPCRFAVPASYDGQTRPVLEIKPLIEARAKEVQASLVSFTAVLNNTKASPDTICASLQSFHCSLADLITSIDEMRASTWNPQCQNELSTTKTSIVSVGDLGIDVSRSRLLVTEGWRIQVTELNSTTNSAIEKVITVTEATARAASADLSVTNEAEIELLAAARAVAASQQRLAQCRTVATTKRTSFGESYIGCEIVDIATPILNSAARLIAAAQEQTRFLLRRDPELPNQKGLVKTARDLVDSLELILVAAEATVNNDCDAISKVLASCNIISSAVAHFLAECYQKNGCPELNRVMTSITDTIQAAIKQLRAYGEHAASSSVPSVPEHQSRPMNAMIAKLNAEAKVVEARRALEAAEKDLKRARQSVA